MKFIISVVLVLSLVSTSLSSVASGDFNNPKHPGKCYISGKLILSPGESKDPNEECGSILCTESGTAYFYTCGLQSEAGAEMGDFVDPTLPYPKCCERENVHLDTKGVDRTKKQLVLKASRLK